MGRKLQPLDLHGQPLAKALSDARLSDRALDELVGICRGVLADEEVSLKEAQAVMRWLDANRDYCGTWPFSKIYERFEAALADGNLDEEESRDLVELLVHVTGGETPIDERVASYASSLPLTRPEPDVIFQGHSFCVTGKFLFGPRRKVQGHIVARGGEIADGIRKTLDFLVIGAVGSAQWIHSTHGRKIEEAVEIGRIAIVSEGHWLDWLEATPPVVEGED